MKQQNLVAKHARTFNKAHVHRDRTKYHRPSKLAYKEDWDFEEDDPLFEEEVLIISPLLLEGY